jgi:predicted metal-dependent hydrolase
MEIHRLLRSKRRSVALIVTEEAKLVIRAPHRLPERYILRFVEQKRSWINKKIAEISSRPKTAPLSKEQEAVYQGLAEKVIPARVKHYSALTGLRPNKVRISNAGKRWGSCSAKGTINISWRLLQFPQEVIDYVVVHELVHLVERNHGKKFWQRVEEIIPDHRALRQQLRSI